MQLRNLATIYILDGNKILLMYRVGSRLFKEPLWVGVGGHFDPGELNDPTACVLRELFEETGIKQHDIKNLTLKYITLRKTQGEIRQQYIFFAELAAPVNIIPCDEGETAWVETGKLDTLKMAANNKKCLRHYFETGQVDNDLYVCVSDLDGHEPFIHLTRLGE
ncbi:MAG: NUDIX domain-containing protein [Oscillospiraceae bacterium]|jgi:8-oxo-dGTP diphosphatase|nr:NUDIX domain-containing protein [Oscillospiraceae bacterium]